MPKLLILSREAREYAHHIRAAKLPDLQVTAVSSVAEALAAGVDFEVLFGDTRMLAEILGQMPNLKWVQAASAGVEPLLAPQLRRDYLLTNAHDVFGDSMSEYVFGHLLAHERRIFARSESQRQHRWDHSAGGRLRGRTLGLLGVGSIGAEIARTAKHFGMTVRGYTRSSESSNDVDAYYHGDGLLDFGRGTDYLVCVLPNTDETRHIVDARLLAALPAQAVLVNVGRGAAVDEAALLEALENNRLALAVLDVFEQEPLPPDHPFWEAPNLWMTFHTSALHEPADMVRPFVENCRRYMRGQELRHRVDFGRGY